MFCPKCGKEVEQDSNFCKSCGFNINHINNSNYFASNNVHNFEQKKSKEEFLRDYRSTHSEIWAYLVFSFIFDIIGAIIIIMNVTKIDKYMLNKEKTEVIFWIIVGLFMWLIGTIFIVKFKACDRKGVEEYERYLYRESRSLEKVESIRIPEQNEWLCPKCGKINANYVGTCGCGEVKPR